MRGQSMPAGGIERSAAHGIGDDALVDVVEPRQRHRAPVRPELVERGLHVAAGLGAEHERVAVAVVERLVPVEVAVLDVASAGDADLAVDEEELVVHALVEAREAADDAGRELDRLA